MLMQAGMQGLKINTYCKTESNSIRKQNLQGLPAASDSVDFSTHSVSQKSLLSKLSSLSSHSSTRPSCGTVVAKDNSVNPDAFVMAVSENDPVSAQFIAQMSQIGRVEGFDVIARCGVGQKQALKNDLATFQAEADRVVAVEAPGVQDVWTEDQGEFTETGALVIPGCLHNVDSFQSIFSERVSRLYSKKAASSCSYTRPGAWPLADFSFQGLVAQRSTDSGMLGGAMACPIKGPRTRFKAGQSYIEGGNFAPGKDGQGKAYALIGKDSVAVTRELLKQTTGQSRVSDRQVFVVIGQDYGIDPKRIFAIEQPGEFHIDMATALIGAAPGQNKGSKGLVLVNDSKAALAQQQQWLRAKLDEDIEAHPQEASLLKQSYRQELKSLRQEVEVSRQMENKTADDLSKAGFQVTRFPGVFHRTTVNPPMNFMNLRQGINEDGEKFAVLLGGTPEMEQRVAEQLLTRFPTGYQRVHFLDPSLTAPTLDLWGGIKCRTKTIVHA